MFAKRSRKSHRAVETVYLLPNEPWLQPVRLSMLNATSRKIDHSKDSLTFTRILRQVWMGSTTPGGENSGNLSSLQNTPAEMLVRVFFFLYLVHEKSTFKIKSRRFTWFYLCICVSSHPVSFCFSSSLRIFPVRFCHTVQDSYEYEGCSQIFFLFAITVFHTDQQLLQPLVLFLLVKTLILMTKNPQNILSDVFFSLS